MLSSRGPNLNMNTSTNNKNKPTISENELVKLFKLHNMISGSTPQSLPVSQPYQQMSMPMMMPQQMMCPSSSMPMSMAQMPMTQLNGYKSELSNSEREDIRRMIYKSNEELEANLKDFIRSNEKKFLEYLKELIEYNETVKKAESIQEDQTQKEIDESTPPSSNQIIETMTNLPSTLSGAFTSMKNTVSKVVTSANNMITGKGSTPETTQTPPTPTPTPKTQSQPSINNINEGTPTTTTTTQSPSPSPSTNKPSGETSTELNAGELENTIDEKLKQSKSTPVPTSTSTKNIEKPDNLPLINIGGEEPESEPENQETNTRNLGEGEGEEENEEQGEEETKNETIEAQQNKLLEQQRLMDKQKQEQIRLREANKKANEQIERLKQEVRNVGLDNNIRKSLKASSQKKPSPTPSTSTSTISSNRITQSGGKSVKKRQNRNQNQNQKQKQKQKSNKKTYIKRRVRKNIL